MCTFLCELGGLEPKCLGLREDCEARSRGGGPVRMPGLNNGRGLTRV